MKLMDKIRSTEARERDARDARHRAAREHTGHEGNRLSTADLAGMESRPVDTRTADATRDDLAHARAARDDERRIDERAARDDTRRVDERDTRDDRRQIDEVAREDARPVDEPAARAQARAVEPAGKLSDADVQDAVEVSRRDPRGEADRTGADARVTNARVANRGRSRRRRARSGWRRCSAPTWRKVSARDGMPRRSASSTTRGRPCSRPTNWWRR